MLYSRPTRLYSTLVSKGRRNPPRTPKDGFFCEGPRGGSYCYAGCPVGWTVDPTNAHMHRHCLFVLPPQRLFRACKDLKGVTGNQVSSGECVWRQGQGRLGVSSAFKSHLHPL